MECIINHIYEELDSQTWEVVVLKDPKAIETLLDQEPVGFRLEDNTIVYIQMVYDRLFAEYYRGSVRYITFYKSYRGATNDRELINEILNDAESMEFDMLEGSAFKEFIYD